MQSDQIWHNYTAKGENCGGEFFWFLAPSVWHSDRQFLIRKNRNYVSFLISDFKLLHSVGHLPNTAATCSQYMRSYKSHAATNN